MANTIFIMFHLNCNLGSDMSGIYFVQLTGNENSIKKFKKINKNNTSLKFYDKEYTYDKVISLLEFDHLWDMSGNDNVERLALVGPLNIPGENKIYEETELEKWWEDFLDDTKFPNWKNIIDTVIDLDSGEINQ